MKTLLVLFSLIPALAFSFSSQEVVENIFKKASQVEVSTNETLQNEINSFVDFSAMTKAVLQNEYKKQTKNEIEWFETTLKKVLSNSVYPSAPQFLNKVAISYKKTQEVGNESTVESVLKNKGEETEVSYKLHKVGSDWKVYDVAIDQESWTKSIRLEVQNTLKKEGWKGLKTRLTKRLETLKNKKK